jgi:diguanylate cyclase (GGDEF)-like protein
MSDFQEQTTEFLNAPPPMIEPCPARKACFMVLTGPDKGAVHPLSDGTQVLGRSAGHAQLIVSGRGLSRAHAEVNLDSEGRVSVRDLDSTNGVFVNGERIQTIGLNAGDTLALGPEVVLRLDTPDESVQALFEEMYQGANRDALTGLLNRRSFLERLHEEHAASERHGFEACLAILDVDHFKSINDTHGHLTGDAVLVELGKRLLAGVRTEDVVGRYGGEEFILLIRHTGLSGATQLMDRLRSSVAAQAFVAGGVTLKVTASIGLTSIKPHLPEEAIIAAADRALYEAKRGGRNRVCSVVS